jgi:hypothetical protein
MVVSLRSRLTISRKNALAELGHRHLGPQPLTRQALLRRRRLALRHQRLAPVTLQPRLPQRQRRVATQRHALGLAVHPVAVVPEHAAGGEHLDDEAALVGAAVALGLGLQRRGWQTSVSGMGGLPCTHDGDSTMIRRMCTHACTRNRSALAGKAGGTPETIIPRVDQRFHRQSREVCRNSSGTPPTSRCRTSKNPPADPRS